MNWLSLSLIRKSRLPKLTHEKRGPKPVLLQQRRYIGGVAQGGIVESQYHELVGHRGGRGLRPAAHSYRQPEHRQQQETSRKQVIGHSGGVGKAGR